MLSSAHLQAAQANRFLRSLTPLTCECILQASTIGELPVGASLHRPGVCNQYCYFLLSGLASVVLPMQEGDSAEVLFIGSEGVTGALQLLGPAANPTSCFMQLAGSGFRVKSQFLCELFRENEEVRTRVLEFVQYQAFTVSQVAGCNRLHDAVGRLSRWLLMAQDRTGSPHLKFTQLFLAQMLGLERTIVGAVIASLVRKHSIEHSRGYITILDRSLLEASACSCYQTLRQFERRLYDPA